MPLANARPASPHHNARYRGARDPSPTADVSLVAVRSGTDITRRRTGHTRIRRVTSSAASSVPATLGRPGECRRLAHMPGEEPGRVVHLEPRDAGVPAQIGVQRLLRGAEGVEQV